jgi:RNA polymerase sigma-70 factor (ECF subfamily)
MRLTRNREDAEDLIQAAALKAWRYYGHFDGSNFNAWFGTVMRRIFFSSRRAASARLAMLEQARHFLDTAARCNVEDGVLGTQLTKALETLPAKQYEISLRALAGQDEYHEIAEDMGIPIGTVMTNVFRARKKLQRQLVA